MLVITEDELERREAAAEIAFRAGRGAARGESPPSLETARKLALLSSELQLLSDEIGSPAFATAWSETTDAFILCRRSAEAITNQLDN